MKPRAEIKYLAREALARQRGTSILILLVYTLIIVAMAIVSILPELTGTESVAGFYAFSWVFTLAVSFATIALSIGVYASFIRIYRQEPVSVGYMFQSLSVNFWRKVGGLYWMALWIFLWALPFTIANMVFAVMFTVTLLSDGSVSPVLLTLWPLITLGLSVPIFIKTLAYFLAPYILADCPGVKARDALKLSIRMTDGHKGKLFVMSLSFIGWILLSVLTLGILYVVYVGPYMYATFAGYYEELRGNALALGVVQPEELE
jgi:uncharacterized membrane protein